MRFLTITISFYVLSVVFALPQRNVANDCSESICKIEDNCRCSSVANPINNNEAPQLVAITVSESVVATSFDDYWRPLFIGRTNPDGNQIGASFYVNHEYTDYELVQKLYLQGFEIGVHSITKNSSKLYWESASLEDLVEEFEGQRQIISHFANIPIDDVVGARTPQLDLEGDLSIEAYVQSGIEYDNSWPTESTKPILPYTLDYSSTQHCLTTMTCPIESHPHFWIAPLTNIVGADGVECNSLAACLVTGTSDDIANWLMGELQKVRSGNRAPMVLRLDSYWFSFTDHSFEGFTKFLNAVEQLDDVFLVSVGDIIEWIKNPVSASNFKTPVHDRKAECNPTTCVLYNVEGNTRYMGSCVRCPLVYPWKGNPFGDI